MTNTTAVLALALSLAACSASGSGPSAPVVAVCTEEAVANCPINDAGVLVEVVADDGSSVELAIDPACLEVAIAGGLDCERI